MTIPNPEISRKELFDLVREYRFLDEQAKNYRQAATEIKTRIAATVNPRNITDLELMFTDESQEVILEFGEARDYNQQVLGQFEAELPIRKRYTITEKDFLNLTQKERDKLIKAKAYTTKPKGLRIKVKETTNAKTK